MKVRVSDPIVAARETGGCTFEPDIGWWTFSTDSGHSRLGVNFSGTRDALYIPTLQKNGEPVPVEAITSLKERAHQLGFTNLANARGMWILLETGQVQTECVWIVWSEKVTTEVREQLPSIVEEVKKQTNQDCVCFEINGDLKFTKLEST